MFLVLRECRAYRVALCAPAARVFIYSCVMRARERELAGCHEAREGFHPRKLTEEPNKTACQLITTFNALL